MRWVSFAEFSTQKAVTLDAGDFVAVGIAASSEIDICLVGGHVLGPQTLVQFSTTVEAIRGLRTGLLPSGVSAPPVGQRLVLQLYERCDVLIPPGPRSPLVVTSDFYVVPAALGVTNPILRVPFAGRKQCAFAVKRSAGTEATDDLSYLVRGVKYNAAAFQKINRGVLVDGADQRCVFTETTTGTVGLTLSTADGASPLNRVFYVGGAGDNQEDFDELELYVFGNAGNAYAQAVATGDRG